jgi:hypothetical protein
MRKDKLKRVVSAHNATSRFSPTGRCFFVAKVLTISYFRVPYGAETRARL